MTRPLPILALAVLMASMAGPVLAQDVPRGLPDRFWYEGPHTVPPGQGRLRIVVDGRRQAALTPNQYWHYSEAFRRSMAALSFRMPVASALPRARAAALTEIAVLYPQLRVAAIPVDEIDGGRLGPRY